MVGSSFSIKFCRSNSRSAVGSLLRQEFSQRTLLGPVLFWLKRITLSFAFVGLLSTSGWAEEIRIAPEDLKLRSGVSALLAPSLRLQLRDLASNTPLPREGGVIETDELLSSTFADRTWDQNRKDLVRFYFLVARMEKSRTFSDEFERRRELAEQGRDLMQTYLRDLNKAIARAVFLPDHPVELGQLREFPLTSVGWEGSGETRQLKVLHDFPPADNRLGRDTLRSIRDVAGSDLELLEVQLSLLDDGEREFIEEVSLIGKELVALRPKVGKLVRTPRAGLPFSF